MFQGCLAHTADETFTPSLRKWPTAGFDAATGFWTAAISESPNVAVACSLSSVLESPADVPTRFYLSPRAARGVLKRALKRGRALPPHLEAALHAVASTNPDEAAKTTAILSQLASQPNATVEYALLPMMTDAALSRQNVQPA